MARSLIDVNSDTVVIEELDPEFYAAVMNSKGKDGVPAQWTDLMVYCKAGCWWASASEVTPIVSLAGLFAVPAERQGSCSR